jgi:hypothetical protein
LYSSRPEDGSGMITCWTNKQTNKNERRVTSWSSAGGFPLLFSTCFTPGRKKKIQQQLQWTTWNTSLCQPADSRGCRQVYRNWIDYTYINIRAVFMYIEGSLSGQKDHNIWSFKHQYIIKNNISEV